MMTIPSITSSFCFQRQGAVRFVFLRLEELDNGAFNNVIVYMLLIHCFVQTINSIVMPKKVVTLCTIHYDIFQLNLYLTCWWADANPASLDGKLQRLPTSLSESVQALEKDDILRDMIGEKLLIAIKGIRKVHLIYGFYSIFFFQSSCSDKHDFSFTGWNQLLLTK